MNFKVKGHFKRKLDALFDQILTNRQKMDQSIYFIFKPFPSLNNKKN